MLPVERHERIAAALQHVHVLPTEDIARQLAVSVETIRRDFMVLEQRGVLSRVHGGAVGTGASYTTLEAPFVDRALLAQSGKAAIGQAAAALVRDGQTVLMDVGTTVLQVARALPAGFRGTIATCSVLVATELADRPEVEVLLSGGRIRGGDLALSNAQTVGFFTDLHADLAFLGSGGLDAAAGLTDFHLDEVATRRVMMSHATRSYLLADHTKLGVVAPHRVCGLEAISGLITDGRPDEELTRALTRHGTELLAG